MIALPPGTPAPAVAALRNAVAAPDRDPDFAAEAMKSIEFAPEYAAAPDTGQKVSASLARPQPPQAFGEGEFPWSFDLDCASPSGTHFIIWHAEERAAALHLEMHVADQIPIFDCGIGRNDTILQI